ncbi:MAG: Rpn family recombination-promoting nuclease/putative transposase [Chitinispirillales bacterium]|jgi:predicted transposase/invertase (TIGR01784 family)|nr:Rpn family recombination-promoting nuclease/putative transposase [Chitinispirillales bacterium]
MCVRKSKTPNPRRTPEFLPPIVDVVFKLLFGDERRKGILAAFLTAVLGFKVLARDITLLDPHLKREHLKDKQSVLDVKLRLRSKKLVNIEMQVENKKDIRNRAEYYISKWIAGQLEEGDKYNKLAPTVMILVSKHTMLPETKEYHSEFGTLEKTKHFELHGLKTIHVLELSKLPKNSNSRLVDWLRFINASKKEDFVTLAQECKHLAKALNALANTSANAEARAFYEDRLKAARDKSSELDYAKDEGRAEGRTEERAAAKKRLKDAIAEERKAAAKTLAEERNLTAKAMAVEGIDAETIAKIMGVRKTP